MSEKSFKQINSPLVFIVLVLTFIGVAALKLLKVESGEIFFTVMVASIVVLVLFIFLLKEESIKFLEYPFGGTLLQGIFWFWAGIGIIYIYQIFAKIFSLTSITQIIRPLYIFSTDPASIVGQTFNVIKVQTSPFWASYFTIWTAGNIETFVFNVIAVIFFVMLAYLIALAINKNVKPTKNNLVLWYSVGFIGASVLFMIAHKLNQTYVGLAFIIAFIFLLVTNGAMYILNLGFMFVAGIHQALNSVALGWDKTMALFTLLPFPLTMETLFSFIITLFYIGTFAYLLFHIKDIPKEVFAKHRIGL